MLVETELGPMVWKMEERENPLLVNALTRSSAVDDAGSRQGFKLFDCLCIFFVKNASVVTILAQ